MPKMLVILNPIAGRGAGARLSSRIVERLQADGLDFELVTTSGPGHATTLARDAALQGMETVVVAGGDGTANEVINGLVEAQEGPDGTSLGILPIGTGNDFAFGADLPQDLEEAFQAVAWGRSRLIDVGWIDADNEEPRFFGNGVGMGFDAIANIESRKVKWLKGDLVYLVAVLKTLTFYYQAPHTVIHTDRMELEQPCLLVSIMNGRRVGSSFYITPSACMNDGLLDLCAAAKVSRAKMVRFVPRFMRGTHITDRDITMSHGQKFTVVSESPWAAHVDGEIYGVGARRYEVELLPQRLRLIG